MPLDRELPIQAFSLWAVVLAQYLMERGVRVNGCFKPKQESTFLDTCQPPFTLTFHPGKGYLVLERTMRGTAFSPSFYGSRPKIN